MGSVNLTPVLVLRRQRLCWLSYHLRLGHCFLKVQYIVINQKHFSFMSSTNKFNVFSILSKHLSCVVPISFSVSGVLQNYCVFFYFPHNFPDRFILTIDLNNFRKKFSRYVKLNIFSLSLREFYKFNLGVSELPASLLLHFGVLLSKMNLYWLIFLVNLITSIIK